MAIRLASVSFLAFVLHFNFNRLQADKIGLSFLIGEVFHDGEKCISDLAY